MPDPAPFRFEQVRPGAQEPDWAHDQVVEVDRAGLRELSGVEPIDARDPLASEIGLRRLELLGGDEGALGVGETGTHGARQQHLLGDRELSHRLFHQRQLIARVGDREPRRKLRSGGSAAEEAQSPGMEGADEGLEPLGSEQAARPLPHFFRGLVGEGHRHDRAGIRPRFDQASQPVGDHSGLARARACQDEKRTFFVKDGLYLFGIQAG